MNDALDWVTADLVTPPSSPAFPSALSFLVREYTAKGQPEVQAALERALAAALPIFDAERDPCARLQWMVVFAEASAIADDERMVEAVQRWLPSVIDGLEGFVRGAYEPGEGLVDATLDAHMRCASALLGAFELTGRLPYSMLAEEILQTARRRWWDSERPFCGDFASTCLAVQVCCRLAALHRDADYAASAVVAVSPTYHEDAARMLAVLEPRYRDHPASAADYGLALLEWFALGQLPN